MASGASRVSERPDVADRLSSPDTFDNWFDATFDTVALTSTDRRAYSIISAPNLRNPMIIGRTLEQADAELIFNIPNRTAYVETGMLWRTAASEKLLTITTFSTT